MGRAIPLARADVALLPTNALRKIPNSNPVIQTLQYGQEEAQQQRVDEVRRDDHAYRGQAEEHSDHRVSFDGA